MTYRKSELVGTWKQGEPSISTKMIVKVRHDLKFNLYLVDENEFGDFLDDFILDFKLDTWFSENDLNLYESTDLLDDELVELLRKYNVIIDRALLNEVI